MKKIILMILSLFAFTYSYSMEKLSEPKNELESDETPKSNISSKVNDPDDIVMMSGLETVEGLFPGEIMEIIILFVPKVAEQIDDNGAIGLIKIALRLTPKNEKLGIINLMLVSKQFNAFMHDPKILVSFLKQVTIKSPQKAIKVCIDAARNANTRVINLFMQAGLAIDACDENGLFMLMMATIKMNTDLVKLLINHKASVNNYCDSDCNYFSNLIKAFKNDQAICLEKRVTPLMFASFNGANNIVQILLEAGANIDAQDNNGNSALMLAASRGLQETVRILMSHGADVYLRNNKGECSVIIAHLNNKNDVMELLLEHDRFAIALYNRMFTRRRLQALRLRELESNWY